MNSLGSRLIVRFGGSPRFWRLRRRYSRLRLTALGQAFRVRYVASETSSSAAAVRALLQNTLLSVGAAILLIAAMALLQGPAGHLTGSLGLGKPDGDTYDSLLETVAAATGVFLALYFTAVSAVAASIYATVPHDIRSLIIGDRLGNIYVRVVAFTMALSILLLVVKAEVGSEYRLAAPIVGVLAVFSIFAFIRLGRHAFYLADPTHLAGTLAERFEGQAARARHGGWRWDVAEVQDHSRRQAAASVATLASLIEIAGTQDHLRGSSSSSLIWRTNLLLARYLSLRHRIPTASAWFGQRYEHPQWFLADASTLQAGTNLAGSLMPKAVPDVHWVENALLPPVLKALDRSLERDLAQGAPGTGYDSLSRLPLLWEQFGANWSAAQAIGLTEELCERVLCRLEGEAAAERTPIAPAIADTLGLVPIALELGFHKTLEPDPIEALSRGLMERDWSDTESPYGRRLPRAVIAALEDAHAGIRFEHEAAAPADTRTPPWFVCEVALFHYERELKDQMERLLAFHETWFVEASERLTAAGRFDPAAAVLSRGLESVWKLDRHLPYWREVVERVRALGTLLDFHRPDWDWDSYSRRLEQMSAAIQRRLALLIVSLAEQERRDDIPDYFGQAVHVTGEACIAALRENSAERFGPLYAGYFYGVLQAVERVREQVSDQRPEQAMTWFIQPLLDLVELSGYALIYSELHQAPALWGPCRDIWDKYLDGERGPEKLAMIAASISFESNRLGLGPRWSIRSAWQSALAEQLSALPRGAPEGGRPFFAQGPVDHPSALIRHITPDDELMSMLNDEAADVFIALYLARRDPNLDFGLREGVTEELQNLDEDDR